MEPLYIYSGHPCMHGEQNVGRYNIGVAFIEGHKLFIWDLGSWPLYIQRCMAFIQGCMHGRDKRGSTV